MKSGAKPFRFLFLFGIAHAQLNLASNGTASQSYTYVENNYLYIASLAVTGEPTHDWYTRSCATTAVDKTVAWWMLTFPSESVFVSNVIISYRSNNPSRLAGYSLYITNNTIESNADKPPSNGLCYHHEGNELPNILQNITCHIMGKHVIIYNERKSEVKYPENYSESALLELCDVQIIGCYKSWWGDGCRKPCPSYCLDNHCYPDNGTCVWGCYSSNCVNNDCTNDGICIDGCITGHVGLTCNETCIPPQFGVSCNGTCHCINQPCDYITGACPAGGCQDGWIGQSCSREILCRTATLPKHITYVPSLSVHRYRQNVTFYCASGFYGTPVDSSCSFDNIWIPSSPICTREAQGDGVSVPVFVSVLVVVIIIAASLISGMWIYYRRRYGAMSQKQYNDKYDDLHVYSKPEMTAEIKETTYEELRGNC